MSGAMQCEKVSQGKNCSANTNTIRAKSELGAAGSRPSTAGGKPTCIRIHDVWRGIARNEREIIAAYVRRANNNRISCNYIWKHNYIHCDIASATWRRVCDMENWMKKINNSEHNSFCAAWDLTFSYLYFILYSQTLDSIEWARR